MMGKPQYMKIMGAVLLLAIIGLAVYVFYTDTVSNIRVMISSKNKSANSTRVLCLILTTTSRKERWQAVNSTWARRCDRHMFVIANNTMKETNSSLKGDFLTVKTIEARGKLTDKVKLAFQFAYAHCNGCFDWVLKADDDTYVIVENLKNMLQHHSPSHETFMGHRFRIRMKHGSVSGGAGYVMSHAALRRLVENGIKNDNCGWIVHEDVYIAGCFQKLNVSITNSRDELGKEGFNVEPLENYLLPPHPLWLNKYSWVKPIFGDDCCSEYPITYHHLSPRQIKAYEHLLYKTRVSNSKRLQNTSISYLIPKLMMKDNGGW